MFIFIEKYINNLSIDELNRLALSKDIKLNNEELEFSYNFIKKYWKDVLSNYSSFNFSRYKDRFSYDNYVKIDNLIMEYSLKYSSYLK